MVDRVSSCIWRNKKRIEKGEKGSGFGSSKNILQLGPALMERNRKMLSGCKISTGKVCSVNLD